MMSTLIDTIGRKRSLSISSSPNSALGASKMAIKSDKSTAVKTAVQNAPRPTVKRDLPSASDTRQECVLLPPCEHYIKASIQQKFLLYCILYGRLNVCLVASAGCGKSFILNTLKELAKPLNIRVLFTATTGKASTLLPDATTLHSFLSVGLAEGPPTQVAKRIAKRAEAREKFANCDLLVIDEVSMLDCRMMECLNTAAKLIRKNNKPFGGIQVVFSGDFFQLPPVKKTDQNNTNGGKTFFRKNVITEDEVEELAIYNKFDFCFEHPEWSTLIDCVVELTVPFRQNKEDSVFLDLLAHVREGKMKEEHHLLLEKICKQTQLELGSNKSLSATIPKLFPFNKNVDEMNEQELDKLDPTKLQRRPFKYKTKRIDQDEINSDEFSSWMDYQKKECMAYTTVSLCKNSLVMLIVNTDTEEGFVNGLDGIVTGFAPVTGYPIVKFSNGVEKVVEYFTWKHVDSRFEQDAASGSSGESLAKFGGSAKLPHVTYEQIPLKLAHAITIHKSQGSTLSRAQMQLPRSIQYGQGYVALSRLRSLEGLKLTQYDRGSIKAHPKALNFYNQLRSSNAALQNELLAIENQIEQNLPIKQQSRIEIELEIETKVEIKQEKAEVTELKQEQNEIDTKQQKEQAQQEQKQKQEQVQQEVKQDNPPKTEVKTKVKQNCIERGLTKIVQRLAVAKLQKSNNLYNHFSMV